MAALLAPGPSAAAKAASCGGVARSVETTLGPCAAAKLVAATSASTSDGATVLASLSIDDPVGQLLCELARAQDNAVGDGTTSVVVLAAELVAQGAAVVQAGVALSWVLEGFAAARAAALTELDALAVTLPSRDAAVEAVARCTVATKIVRHDADRFARLLADALAIGAPRVRVHRQLGQSLSESALFRGLVVPGQPAGARRPQSLRVAVLRQGLDKLRTGFHRLQAAPDVAEGLAGAETAHIRSFCERLASLGVGILVCSDYCDTVAQEALAAAGITCLYGVALDLCDGVAQATGATTLAALSNALTADQLGEADSFELDDGARIARIGARKAGTVVLRGGSQAVLDECGRALEDALLSLSSLARAGHRVVGGGGASYLAMAAAIRRSATGSSKAIFSCEAAARALERIPLVLAANGGWDAPGLVAQARARHAGPPSAATNAAGIDARTGCLVDDTIAAGLVDPLPLVQHVVDGAFELATLILQVDRVITLPERKAPRP